MATGHGHTPHKNRIGHKAVAVQPVQSTSRAARARALARPRTVVRNHNTRRRPSNA